jgi:outer membrane biogenesis lipoprotein LolB
LRKLFFIILAAVVSVIYFEGCVPSKPTEELEILPSERLINKLEVNRRRIKSFEGSGTISIKSSALNTSANFKVVMQKPDSISLTILGPFGIELAQALVTNDSFVFYDALQNTAYTGSVDDEVLRNIFRIDLSFNDLLDAFIGSVNLTDKLYRAPDKYDVIYDEYVLTYNDSLNGTASQYKVDIRELGIKNFWLRDLESDKVLLEGKYTKFDLLESVAVPYRVEVVNHRQNQQMVIDYRNMNANNKNIYIDFKLPGDATVIEW